MNKTMTRMLMWSICLCCTSLVWGNTHSISSDTLPPQLIQHKATGTRLASNVILLQANGGDEYHWSNGASTPSINITSPTSPEKYSVHIKRRKTHENWVFQQNVYSEQVGKNKSIAQVGCQNLGLSWQSAVCAGASVTIHASGGSNYEWNTGETTNSITVFPTGGEIYTVKITGAGDCYATLSTASAPMEVIPVPVAQITVSNNECSAIGAILTASGGETYLWAGGQNTPSIVTEEIALYEVQVSNGNGLCSDTESIWVTTNFQPKISGDAQLCQGYGTTLTASGGNSYLWGNGATSSSITVLPTDVGSRTYKVRVNAGNCSKEVSHTINVKATPNAQISGPSSVCYNGSVTLNGSGSGSYAWSTGANTSSISTSLLQNSQTYRLTVTDPSTQCSSVDEHVVSVLPRPTLNEAPNSICTGESVSLSVSGGNTYSWNVGGTTASIVDNPTSSTEYKVTVTDANGCQYTLSKRVDVVNPPSIRFNEVSICAGQSATISAFGASSYQWNTGANTGSIVVAPTITTTYTVTATSSGCSNKADYVLVVKPVPAGRVDGPESMCPGQTTTLLAVGEGTYRWSEGNASTNSIQVSPSENKTYGLSITNAAGCVQQLYHSVAVNIKGSASNDGPLTCSKTSVMLRATTGAAGASFSWRNAQGVEIATTATTAVSMPGVYNLVITGAGGCTVNAATDVVQNVQVPEVNAHHGGALTCTQTQTTLLGSTSASPASYEWRNGSGTLIANTLNTSVTQAGTYTLKVTAANGCSSTASTTVTTDVATPQASIQHDGPLSCTKTSVTLSASPNNPNLQYTWRNSGGTIIASNSPSVVVTATGTYQLQAKGSNGCTTTVSTNITQSGNFPNISVNNPGYISCTSSGATISGNSTTPGVTYAWYNPNGRLMSTQKSFVTNIAGTYTLKVTSTEGCVSSASTTLGEDVPNDQAITLNVGGYSTNGSFAQGELTCTQNSIRLSVSARYAGYDAAVYWRTDAHGVIGSGNFEDVDAPGYYYVYHQECPAVVKEIYIKENRPAPVVQITGEKLVCVGQNTTLTASGGNQYYWSTGATSNTITAYVAGPATYTVTVSKGAYCSTEASVTVDNHPYPIFNISGPTSSCAGTFVTLTVSGGHTYRWSHNNATTASINVAPTVPTSYTVTVTSDKGCATNRRHTISTVNS